MEVARFLGIQKSHSIASPTFYCQSPSQPSSRGWRKGPWDREMLRRPSLESTIGPGSTPSSPMRTSGCKPGPLFSNCWSFPGKRGAAAALQRQGGRNEMNQRFSSTGSLPPSQPLRLGFTKLTAGQSAKPWVEVLLVKQITFFPSSFEGLFRSRCCGKPGWVQDLGDPVHMKEGC